MSKWQSTLSILIGITMKVITMQRYPRCVISSAKHTNSVGGFGKALVGLAAKATAPIAPLMGTAAAEKTVGQASQSSAKQMMAAAVAIVALGAGVLLAGAGLSLMAQSAVALANSGGAAVAIMGGMVVALAGLAAGAALIGPALTAGAVGFVAFGAGILMCGAGLYLVTSGVSQLAGKLPVIASYGMSAALGINRPIDTFNHYLDALRYSLQCSEAGIKINTFNSI